MVKAILFDWHGVLDKRTFSGMLEVIARGCYAYGVWSEIKEYISVQGIVRSSYQEDGMLYAAGGISPAEFWGRLAGDLPDEIVERARNYILKVERNVPLWGAIPKLKLNYHLGILSDCPEDKTRVIKETVDLSDFEHTYFSSDHGLLKRDPDFFRKPLKDMNLRSSGCLFVDDSEINLQYAKKLGFATVLYHEGLDLESVLGSPRFLE